MTTSTPAAEIKITPARALFALLMLGLGIAFPIWAGVQLAQHGPNPFMVAFIVLSVSAVCSGFTKKGSFANTFLRGLDRFFDVTVILYFSYQLVFVGFGPVALLWAVTFAFTFVYRIVYEWRERA